jgi:hypothetical protein
VVRSQARAHVRGVIRKMVTEIGQTQFNFNVICEGLRSIAATREEQLSLNKEGLTYLDDIFDPMPLEYVS